MTGMRKLENIWSEVRTVDINGHLTDRRLLFLGWLHLSIHSLIVCTHPQGLREEHTDVLRRMGQLFDECLRRCRQTGKKEVRAAFVPLLYRLGIPEYEPLDIRRWEQCDRQAELVILSWEQEGVVPWEFRHDIMRAVTELFNESDKAERQGDPVFQKYEDTLAGWKREASDNLIWENIPCQEVLSRLELFCRNSTLLLDYTYDEWILSAYASYSRTIRVESSSDEVCLLLLALEQWSGQPRHNSEIITRIQTSAAGRMSSQAPDTDGYWVALSLLTECLCMKRIESFWT